MSIPEKPHVEGQEFTNPATGITYKYDGVKWIASGGEELDLSGYVRTEGGDSMQGPLTMRPQDGANGRATSKVQTLGVFSNSEGSALRLGTTRDRVYVGHNDVSINGPLKVDEIHEKNNGSGTQFSDDVHFKGRNEFGNGIRVEINDPNTIDTDHADFDSYSKFPLIIKSPSGQSRLAVSVGDGAGPYSLDENGNAYQGKHINNLATIGLLKDKAVKSHPKEVLSMGGLSLSIVRDINDTEDCDHTLAKIKDDYSKIVLNHDPLDSGPRVDWLSRFPGDSTMIIQQGDKFYTLETTAVGASGTNSRAKHFNIRSHNITAGEIQAGRIEVGSSINEASEPFLVSQEEFQELSSRVTDGGDLSDYVTKSELQQAIDDLKAEFDQQRFETVLHDSPFVSNTNNAQLWYTSNSSVMPGNEQLYGTRFSGSSLTANRYPANWNSSLRLGTGIIALDQNGSKINIPLGYEADWTGTVSIYEFEPEVAEGKTKLSLIFKNSVHHIRRAASNGIVYITFGKTSDGHDIHHPIFGRGDLQGDLKDTRVIVVLDVYRIGDRYDPLGDGVRMQPTVQKDGEVT